MDLADIMQRLGVALGLGLLVGLQRERTQSRFGGLRTFPLVTILGALCGLLAGHFGGWIVAAGLVALAAILVIANVVALEDEGHHPGITTEVAMIAMFGVGAYLVVGQVAAAVAVGAGTAVLLEFKGTLHGMARRLTDSDVTAIMRFALLSLVILPVLPNESFGPYDVLNLRKIWLMIVLIVGISLAGYLIYKFFGQGAGIVLGGVLGGMISSTATTVSYAKRTKGAPEASQAAALVIVIASAVVFARLLVEIAAVAPGFLRSAAPPIAGLLGVMAVLSAGVWLRSRDATEEMPEQGNPSELKPALVFGALYAAVTLAVAAAEDYFGSGGLYVVAAISGLTDVDAITLSTSQLVHDGALHPGTAWRVIVLAALSNLVFKAGTVAALGERKLFYIVATLFGITVAAGVCAMLFWPDGGGLVPAPAD